MDFDTLYQDVLAQPEDDSARRVLADFLSENGDPHGELIRVQCDLSEKGPRASRALRVMEAGLLAEHGPALHARFTPWATEVVFARGFPALAWTTVSWLVAQGSKGLRLPGLALVLDLEEHDDGEALVGNPVLEDAHAIELSRGLLGARRSKPPLAGFWKPLAAAKTLTSLHLDEVHTPDEVRSLLELSRLRQLDALSVRSLATERAWVEPLLEELAALDRLRVLDLAGSNLAAVLPALTRLISRGKLKLLLLDQVHLAREGLDAIGRAAEQRAGPVVSITRNSGVLMGWRPSPTQARTLRQDPEDERARVRPRPKGDGPLGQIGTWALDDLVGRRGETCRYLGSSGEFKGLVTHLAASAASMSANASDLALTRDALERAARGLVGLSHPNLVRWLDFGVHDTGVFVVHELVPGRSIRGLIESPGAHVTPLDPARAAGIALDVCRALVSLHQAGRVHGAVNETTVFASPGSTGRVLPLGLDAPTFYGARPMRYLSPEQAQGQPHDERGDLFQLGVLLYFMLSARHPFDDGGHRAVVTNLYEPQRRHMVPLPSAVRPAVRELVDQLLNVDPERRPQSAEEVLVELAMRSQLSMTGTVESPPPADTDWLQRAVSLARLLAVWGPSRDRGD